MLGRKMLDDLERNMLRRELERERGMGERITQK